jgi:hypothetical protein
MFKPSVTRTIRRLPVCFTTICSHLYHRPISHINITYLYHVSISHTYTTYQYHVPVSHIYITQPTFPLVFYSCADLPLFSVEHSTRPTTALCRTFYTTCHCSQQNILHDLPLLSAEQSTRPATALSRTFYTTWSLCDTWKVFCNMHNRNVYKEN